MLYSHIMATIVCKIVTDRPDHHVEHDFNVVCARFYPAIMIILATIRLDCRLMFCILETQQQKMKCHGLLLRIVISHFD